MKRNRASFDFIIRLVRSRSVVEIGNEIAIESDTDFDFDFDYDPAKNLAVWVT